MISESDGAGTAYSPSPPVTVYHFEPSRSPLDGPHQALLS
jgi:hypothetical protein